MDATLLILLDTEHERGLNDYGRICRPRESGGPGGRHLS